MTPQPNNGKAGTAAMILLAFLLFFLPSMLTLLSHDSEPRDMVTLNLMMATCYTGIFCVNYLLLVPEILFRKDNKWLFFAVNLTLILALCSLAPTWFETHGGLPQPRDHKETEPTTAAMAMAYARFAIRDGVMMILSIALAYALCLTKAREKMRQRVLELEAERRNTELLSLKAQLNPHFLFNSLNNIYALIAIDPEKAQQSLHELSGMLRFMIYDAEADRVPLQKEMQFIKDFTRLMSLRLNQSVILRCNIPEINDGTLRIAPLLLLTLVENAFKHVASPEGEGFIIISITSDEERLSCTVENSCSSETQDSMEKGESGVGLKNIEKQLQLIYPGMYSLSTGREGDTYRACLEIKTSALRG